MKKFIVTFAVQTWSGKILNRVYHAEHANKEVCQNLSFQEITNQIRPIDKARLGIKCLLITDVEEVEVFPTSEANHNAAIEIMTNDDKPDRASKVHV